VQVVSVKDALGNDPQPEKVTSDLDFINDDEDQRREYARALVSQQAIVNSRGEQEVQLRGQYAKAAGGAVLLQIAIADYFFYRYADSSEVDWNIPGPVILGWLGATVVQVIGILLVITRSLFPNKDKTEDKPK